MNTSPYPIILEAIGLRRFGVIQASDLVSGPKTLLPYTPGQRITYVKFLPDTFALFSCPSSVFSQVVFMTPLTSNTNNPGFPGFASAQSSGFWRSTGAALESGEGMDINFIYTGNSDDGDIIPDEGPLVVALYLNETGTVFSPMQWKPHMPVAVGDTVIGAGHVQQYTQGGITGATEPAWNTSGSTTTDGTATAFDLGDITVTGAVHVEATIEYQTGQKI